jgi:endo-1,4-beta-xylanase
MRIARPSEKRKGVNPARLIAAAVFLGLLAACAQATAAATHTPTQEPAVETISGTATKTPRPTEVPLTAYPSLYETFAGDFLVGAAVKPSTIGDRRHAALLARHFNSLTVEDEMKPGELEPTEGIFRWDGPDKLAEFAKAHGMAMHGHTLVWHNQAAEWMFQDKDGKPLEATPENKQIVLGRLEDYIRAVVGRYKDVVNVWDVVNEVVDPAQPDCMRRSRWYTLTGAEYIPAAFRTAHEAAPDARLIINEYDTTEPAKRECLYQVVRDLLARGVPVGGVGHQMHINIEKPEAAAIEETIVRIAELGLPQHITELDVSIYTDATDAYKIVPEEILVKQGYRYKEIFEIFRRQAAYIDSVTFWGLADDHSWLRYHPISRADLPLLFDERLQPKPAYWGVVDPSKLPALIGFPETVFLCGGRRFNTGFDRQDGSASTGTTGRSGLCGG